VGKAGAFDPESQQSKNVLKFLKKVKQEDLLYNLLIVMNSPELKDSNIQSSSYLLNQQQLKIKRIGLVRLKSLELFHSVLVLLYPGLGSLALAGLSIQGAKGPDAPHEDVDLKNYVSTNMKRKIVKTMLVVIKEYSYCSIAN